MREHIVLPDVEGLQGRSRLIVDLFLRKVVSELRYMTLKLRRHQPYHLRGALRLARDFRPETRGLIPSSSL